LPPRRFTPNPARRNASAIASPLVDPAGRRCFSDPVASILRVLWPAALPATAELPYRAHRLDPGTGQMTIAVGDMKRPNGFAFSPDEKLLYVIDTPGPGQRTIQLYDIVDNGTAIANRREFNSAERGGSDGMRIGVRGRKR
jgi:gluconolactonase